MRITAALFMGLVSALSACSAEPDPITITADDLSGRKDELVLPLEDGAVFRLDPARGVIDTERIRFDDGEGALAGDEVLRSVASYPEVAFDVTFTEASGAADWAIEVDAARVTSKRAATCYCAAYQNILVNGGARIIRMCIDLRCW